MNQLPGLDSLAAATDRAFLACVAAHPEGISRAQISASTNISKPAISDAAARLLATEVIREAGRTSGRPGRVATLLTLNPDRGHALVVEINALHLRVAAVDLTGELIGDVTQSLAGGEAPDELSQRLRGIIAELEGQVTTARLAVTVSVAQPVVRGTYQVAGLDPTPFPAGSFDPVTDLGLDGDTLLVDNDVNWATLAEADRRDTDQDFLYVYIGAGIGSGLFIDGRVRVGAHGFSGELGYTEVDEGVDLTRYLVARGFGSQGVYRLDPELGCAVLEDPDATLAAEEALAVLGRVVLNATLVLNPALVVVGGPLGKHPKLVQRISQALATGIDPPQVELSLVGDEGPFHGALVRAIRQAREAVGFAPG